VKLSRRGQRGFTLIELMIALVVSALLVGMILAIFLRMSLAYRGQQQVSGVQQVLAAARATFEADAKQAGLAMSQGFTIGNTALQLHSPVMVVNSSTGPDQIAFYYADQNTQAAIPATAVNVTPTVIDVDNATGFAQEDVVVMSTPDVTTTDNPLGPGVDAKLAMFSACVLKISNVTGNTISFTTALPYGSAGNAHCVAPVKNKTMLYKFIGRSYRIDTTRPVDGPLQVSPSGDLVGLADWQDLAYGFTDIQVATQFFDNDLGDSPDADLDPKREWYSSTTQQTLTATQAGPLVPPIEATISLVARTDRDVEGVASLSTPALVVVPIAGGGSANNTLGDHDPVTLPSGTDPALQGSRIYRYITFQVDFRNLGVGR
jgi:prepilin-type N-terminal cleavage/methylation domain-containing protein